MNDKIIKAVMFDLDDTLLDRNKAVDTMFGVIIEKCYKNIEITETQHSNMLHEFKIYDNRGYSDKVVVLNTFFDKFPPSFRIPENDFMEFWNSNFPKCFIFESEHKNVVMNLKEYVKTAIITNGSVRAQRGKIEHTNLDKLFEVILISKEIGISKPDVKIFEMALNKLDVLPENALFVGDNLINDIGGCQSAGIRGIWFNPNNFKNETNIKPFAEIKNFAEILDYINI